MPDPTERPPDSLRIVLLTNGSSHGWAIARALHSRRIPIAAIVLERPDAAALGSRALARLRRYGPRALAGAIARRVTGRIRRGSRRRTADWSALGAEVHSVPALDGASSLAIVRRLAPDIVILGGAPLLRGEILAIPRLGTLNAHPGLLPRYRGIDVVAWAILNGDPVGVSVHLVDAGIDTGAICRTRHLALRAGETLEEIQSRAEQEGAQLMAEVVADAITWGRIEASAPSERHPLRRRMDEGRMRQVRERLAR